MITLFRWILLKQKEIKYKLAFWKFVDKYVKEITKNPEKLEKKLMDSLAEIINKTNQTTQKN